MNRLVYFVLILLVLTAGTWFRFAASHERLPVGCDEFGYLDLARSFDSNITPEARFDRAAIRGLADTLRRTTKSDLAFSWMITPHAYHLVPGSDKIVNQYPPATSYVLHLLPFRLRHLAFPALMTLLMFLPLFFTRKHPVSSPVSASDLLLPVLWFVFCVSAPFTTELARVNSLAPTFGLLAAAGMLLASRPYVACLLIALTVNFRIANLILLIPAMLFLPWFATGTRSLPGQALAVAGRALVLLLVAVSPLLIYNQVLMGSPFVSGYGVADTAFADLPDFLKNLRGYLSWSQHWFRVHIIVMVAWLMLAIRFRMSRKHAAGILLFAGINYLFFCTHAVFMDYYPYASSMIILGAALAALSQIPLTPLQLKSGLAVAALFALITGITGYLKYQKREHLSAEEARREYAALCEADVVWCDLYSGTSEYGCDNYGFRYHAGTRNARRVALQYLYENRYRQLLIPSDIPMPADSVIGQIKSLNLPYRQVNDPKLGNLIYIP